MGRNCVELKHKNIEHSNDYASCYEKVPWKKAWRNRDGRNRTPSRSGLSLIYGRSAHILYTYATFMRFMEEIMNAKSF